MITHGEPHPGNLIHSADGLLLVDWDTVSLAPPERDLGLLRDRPVVSTMYSGVTGREVSTAAPCLYALAWRLTDVASFVPSLREPHERTEDTEHALEALGILLPA